MADLAFRAPRARLACAGLLAVALAGPASAQDTDGLGRTVFLETSAPACAICHTLADAGAQGKVGPSLDALKPTRERVHTAVTGGVGIMPAFEDSLSQEEIDAVSDYVAQAVGAAD